MKWNHWESWSWSKHILDNPFFTYQFCLIIGDISFYRTGCLIYLKRPLVMSSKCLGVPDQRLFSVSWKKNETIHKRHTFFDGVSRLRSPQKVTLGYMVHKKKSSEAFYWSMALRIMLAVIGDRSQILASTAS